MKTQPIKTKKPVHSHHPGVIVVENLPKAKPSPGMQARIEAVNAFLRENLPEGWAFPGEKDRQSED